MSQKRDPRKGPQQEGLPSKSRSHGGDWQSLLEEEKSTFAFLHFFYSKPENESLGI